MKKLMLLMNALVMTCAPAVAKDVKQAISPEDLFHAARKECPELRDASELPAIRACIAQKKGEIIKAKDPMIAKKCEKHSGAEHDQCVDWYYLQGPKAGTYTSLRYNLAYPKDDARPYYAGEHPGDPNYNAPEHTPGGITGGRNTSTGARHYDPRSNKSTVTGTLGAHSGTAAAGGVAPENQLSRPSFLGGGTTPAPTHVPTGPHGAAPSSKRLGGVRLGGTATKQSGDLGIKDEILKLPGGTPIPSAPTSAPPQQTYPSWLPVGKPLCSPSPC